MNGNQKNRKLMEEIIKLSGGKINAQSINKAQSGDISAILSALPPDKQKQFKSIINNKEKTQKILNSKQAQDILNSLLKKNNDG